MIEMGSGRQRSPRFMLRLVGIILVAVALLITFYAAVAYVAWQRGQTLRSERARTQLQEEMVQQMSLARSDIEASNYALAERRLEWVLQRDPNYPGAQTLYAQARSRGQQLLTPQAPPPSPTPPPTPMPTPTAAAPEGQLDPGQELARLRQLLADEKWEESVTAVAAFQLRFPDYERPETDRLLYQANIGYGLKLLYTPQVELGLFYLAQAARLGDLPEEVADQRFWGELYLLAAGFYGVDWNAAVFYFRDLCLAAPFFQNACQRLHAALVAHGDMYAALEDWCPAVERYREAQQQQATTAVRQKLDEAFINCQNATPTPEPGENGDDGDNGDNDSMDDGAEGEP
jgi:hypothetical protein